MGISSFIVLADDKNTGTYYGVGLNRDSSIVYYKCYFKMEHRGDKNVYFKLDNFKYSFNPIYAGKASPNFIDDERKVPFTGNIYFTGETVDDMLVLERVMDIYDNRFDNMTFYKISH